MRISSRTLEGPASSKAPAFCDAFSAELRAEARPASRLGLATLGLPPLAAVSKDSFAASVGRRRSLVAS
jgi:hypothetical protein